MSSAPSFIHASDHYPSEHLREALEAAGIERRLHSHLTLRMLVAMSLNCTVPAHRTVNDVADMVLGLAQQGMLERPATTQTLDNSAPPGEAELHQLERPPVHGSTSR
jgi:hypothetical protein